MEVILVKMKWEDDPDADDADEDDVGEFEKMRKASALHALPLHSVLKRV